jgi:hypothetical protein
MPSPFSGMDPYIEREAIWGDFHNSLIVYISAALQPLLKPRHVALIQERRFLVRYGRHEEEERQSFATIIVPPEVNRIVTAIEVVSPNNKTPGPGRDSYLRQRETFFLERGINLVEIDLLHEGAPTVRIATEKLASFPHWNYPIVITRASPMRQEVYAFPLRDRLPRISIPVGKGDQDALLDLPVVFTRCWNEGPYPEALFYDGPPPGKWSVEEIAWCEQQLRQAGYRPQTSTDF